MIGLNFNQSAANPSRADRSKSEQSTAHQSPAEHSTVFLKMGLKMVNQIDLFNTESPEKSGIQTLGFHYQIEKNLLIVTDLKSQKKHKYVMRGFIYADIKSNLIARFKKVLADRKTLPGAFFKSFMSVEIIKSELKTFENL